MTLFSVFDRRHDEAPALVPDCFSWFAALLPPVFALVHGFWLELVAFVLGVAVIVLASTWLGTEAGFWIYVLFAIWIGFEAGAIRRRALRRQGFVYRSERFARDADGAAVDWVRRRGAP